MGFSPFPTFLRVSLNLRILCLSHSNPDSFAPGSYFLISPSLALIASQDRSQTKTSLQWNTWADCRVWLLVSHHIRNVIIKCAGRKAETLSPFSAQFKQAMKAESKRRYEPGPIRFFCSINSSSSISGGEPAEVRLFWRVIVCYYMWDYIIIYCVWAQICVRQY